MRKIILDRWQGLGDNLQISTIPRKLYEKYGEKCVWISDSTFYRNPEIRKLVWENNPFVAGFTDEPGESMRPLIRFGQYNWIEMWERLYGCDGPYSGKPEVYLKAMPEGYDSFSDSTVVDISYSRESLEVNKKTFPNFIDQHKSIIYDLCNSGEKVVKVRNPNLDPEASVDLIQELTPELDVDVVEVQTIEDYCSLISKCKDFISTHSGNHSLASALRDSSKCIIPLRYAHMKYFTFDNIKYLTIDC
tara:strand:- start:724 stop:1464 length:741 start_codon:yes stop_codon:yes gene_type:complete